MAIVKTSAKKQETKDEKALKQIMSAPAPEKKEPVIVTSTTKRGPGRPPAPKAQAAAAPAPAPKPQMPPGAIQITGPGATPEALSGIALKDMLRTMQALGARVQELEAHLASLANKKPSKPAVGAVTQEQLITGVDTPATDWREPYQGYSVKLYCCQRLPPTKDGKEGDFVVYDDKEPCEYFLCLPRDFDPGKEGPSARAQGRIAAHWGPNEAGEYAEQPTYFSKEELAAVWLAEE